MPIEDFYDLVDGEYLKYDDFNCDYVKSVVGYSTPSVSEESKIQNNTVKYVMKHKVNKKLYKITNQYGKSVTVTEDHSVIVKHKKTGKISKIKPSKLNVNAHFIINIVDTDSTIGDKGAKEVYK